MTRRSTSRTALALRRIMLRTERGPLRPLWWACHEAVIRALGVLYRRERAAVFVRGSFASGEPVFGLSDIDVIVVAGRGGGDRGEAHARVRARHEALCRRLPLFARIVQHFFVYEVEELREASRTTALTFGLEPEAADGARRRAAYRGPAPLADEEGLAERPGLYGPMADWRLVAGRDLRPAVPSRGEAERRLSAWLELQFWWRYAFQACSEPDRAHVPFLCVKLVAEPLRIWLWLAGGERFRTRSEVLDRALAVLPDEEEAITWARELLRTLDRSPDPPLADALSVLLRMSARIDEVIRDGVAAAGTTEVRLRTAHTRDVGLSPRALQSLRRLGTAGSEPLLLPLCDWRSLVVPSHAEEVLAVVGARADDPAVVAAAAAAGSEGIQPALATGGLLVLPATGFPRTVLRAVQSSVTDPVSFALVAKRPAARFANAAGWSASDWARRAVAEHRAWLDPGHAEGRRVRVDFPPALPGEVPVRLVRLLTAARAALFAESLQGGRPELAVDVESVAEALQSRSGVRALGEVTDAFHAVRASGVEAPGELASALERAVLDLPAYSGLRPGLGVVGRGKLATTC
jgi:hypothetical protein